MRPHLAENRMPAVHGITRTDAREIERGLEKLRFERSAVCRVIMGHTLIVEKAESFVEAAIVRESGGHDVAIAAEFTAEVFFFHHQLEGIPFLHIVHEVHLMAEHIGELDGKSRAFPGLAHGLEQRVFHLTLHSHELGIEFIHIHRSREALFRAGHHKAALIVDVIQKALDAAVFGNTLHAERTAYTNTVHLEDRRNSLDRFMDFILFEPLTEERAKMVAFSNISTQYLQSASVVLKRIARVFAPRHRIRIAGDTAPLTSRKKGGERGVITGSGLFGRGTAVPEISHPGKTAAYGGQSVFPGN